MPNLFDDDPERDAEAAALAYARHHGAVEETYREVLADMVMERVAALLGDDNEAWQFQDSAYRRLHAAPVQVLADLIVDGYAEHAASEAARVVRSIAALRHTGPAVGVVAMPCPDSHGHWQLDVAAGRNEVSRMRTARGCCGWCGRQVTR